MGFKPSDKVLVALRGVYNLPFYLDDPVSRCQEQAHNNPASTQEILRGIQTRVYYGGVDQDIR